MFGDDTTEGGTPPASLVFPAPDQALPPRVAARPHKSLWLDDETMTLPEAAALFFPNGPLTETSFRTAVKAGKLAFVYLNRRLFTTPGAVKAMLTPRPAPPAPPPPAQKSARPAQGGARGRLAAAYARSKVPR